MNDPIYAAQQHEIAALCHESEKFKAENAKLRTFAARLVRQLFDYTQNPVTRGVICDEASELGIEVDDG